MEQKTKWLERPIHPALPALTNEVVLFGLVILLAIATRFYDLGTRVMSHDESLHTYYSWLLFRGQGYQHTPMMHGPFQFHIIALTYFLFGVSDFTARIPAALFGIATVWIIWYWRHFLGKAGAIIAALLMVISPYMLFYSRYVRNESYVAFSGVVMLYATLRYLETGKYKYLFFFTAALLLHYVTKETSYIYAAQALLFFAIYFIARVTRRPWQDKPADYRAFIIALVIGMIFMGAAGVAHIYSKDAATLSGTETAAPAAPGLVTSPLATPAAASVSLTLILALLALAALGAAAYFLIRGYGWQRILGERSFDLLILSGTLVLPLLTAFLIEVTKSWLKVTIPTDGPSVQSLTSRDIFIIAIFMLITFGLSAFIGWLWKRALWWKLALTFWVPFTVLYTTFFTNSDGFFTGLIGSLGYWIVQQDVQRGSQPWYYYLLVQIPVYEFLPALGLILAIFLAFLRKPTASPEGPTTAVTDDDQQPENLSFGQRISQLFGGASASGQASRVKCVHCGTINFSTAFDCIACSAPLTEAEPVGSLIRVEESASGDNFTNMFGLLLWWSLTSVAALSYAGERMPWLTVHIAWPMILLTGWALGHLLETMDWEGLRQQRAWITLGTVVVFIASFANALLAWNINPPFQGKELAQLQATAAFVLPAFAALASGIGLLYLLRTWNGTNIKRVFALTFFALLVGLTVRASFRASYINYDDATEFLVYAHGATGIKQVMAQAEEISQRTVGGLNVAIAYDASAPDTGVSWPFVWYLRDYTNQRSFDAPTRALRDSVVVVVDSKNFDKIEPALGPNYFRVDYIRMAWPMQDYFGLVNPREASIAFDENYSCKGALGFLRLFKDKDYSRVCSAILDPQIRAGLFEIWWNRDYTRFAQATNRSDLTLATWQPADEMRLYIRKDVAAQIWNYGVGPVESAADVVDPTEGKTFAFEADLVINSNQIQPVPMNAPRSLAFARDGSFYVADSLNHRILHLDPSGQLLGSWGTVSPGCPYPGSPPDNIPPGTFCEPWGVAVGPDGSVYVTDTWNHRVQKFSAAGRPLLEWGIFGQGETLDALYGPRGIAVDAQGHVYVADTGNKRIVVFDANGNPLTQIGSGGFDPGQFDEPVGVAVDADGRVYVVDTWNQRAQTFMPSADGLTFTPERQWDVYGWFGQSLDNKPFIAVDAQKHVFITDPEGYRVMEFSDTGELLKVWGDYGDTPNSFGLTSGIAVDAEGHVWVTDAAFHRILRFTIPQ